MMTVPHATVRWRKSSRSSGEDTCVELACEGVGLVRDSKNPTGPTLVADRAALVSAAKAGQLG